MNVMPEFQKMAEWRRGLTTSNIFMYRRQENAEFHPIPDRVEIIPNNGEGPEQLSGGCSRSLQQFQCENVDLSPQGFQCMQ